MKDITQELAGKNISMCWTCRHLFKNADILKDCPNCGAGHEGVYSIEDGGFYIPDFVRVKLS